MQFISVWTSEEVIKLIEEETKRVGHDLSNVELNNFFCDMAEKHNRVISKTEDPKHN